MPDNPMQIAGVLVMLIAVMVAILVGASILGAVSSSAGGDASLETRERSPLVSVGDAVSFQDTSLFAAKITAVEKVRDSRGKAILLTGSGSSYTSQKDLQLPDDDTWTVSVHAAWNQSYNTSNGTVYSLNGRIILQYDNSTQQWIGYYYSEGDRDAYRVSAAAPSQPGNLTNVQLVANETHFAIYVNGTRGGVENLGLSSAEEPLLNASNWAGRQDELRLYDQALSQSQRDALRTTPILPVNNAGRQFRVMFDNGNYADGSEPVYFTDTSLDVVGTSHAAGIPGHTLTSGSDYRIDTSAGTITALSGGRLDVAPTAFITYEVNTKHAVNSLTNDIAGSFELFAVVPIIFVGGVLLFALNGLYR